VKFHFVSREFDTNCVNDEGMKRLVVGTVGYRHA
jgi:hypothetical protein